MVQMLTKYDLLATSDLKSNTPFTHAKSNLSVNMNFLNIPILREQKVCDQHTDKHCKNYAVCW